MSVKNVLAYSLGWGIVGVFFVYACYKYKDITDEEWAIEKKQRKEAREFVKDVMSA